MALDNPVLRNYQQDNEFVVLLHDTETHIVCGVHFPANRYSAATMGHLARNFAAFVELMVREPTARIAQADLLE